MANIDRAENKDTKHGSSKVSISTDMLHMTFPHRQPPAHLAGGCLLI